MPRVNERNREIPPARLAVIAPRKIEAFMISAVASDDSDPIRLRAGKRRAELDEGGLRDSLPSAETVEECSWICRPLTSFDKELLARLADPLRINGRGPPSALPLEGRPWPILSTEGDPVNELARLDNFSVRPATGDVDVG